MLVVLVTSGCGEDPSAVYRDAAVKTLEGTLSDARSAELAGRLWVEGSSTHAVAVVVTGEGDEGVGSNGAWFEEQQPPRRTDDAVRDQTTKAVDAAASAVQNVRISLKRSDVRGTRAALDELRSACAQVEALAEGLS